MKPVLFYLKIIYELLDERYLTIFARPQLFDFYEVLQWHRRTFFAQWAFTPNLTFSCTSLESCTFLLFLLFYQWRTTYLLIFKKIVLKLLWIFKPLLQARTLCQLLGSIWFKFEWFNYWRIIVHLQRLTHPRSSSSRCICKKCRFLWRDNGVT